MDQSLARLVPSVRRRRCFLVGATGLLVVVASAIAVAQGLPAKVIAVDPAGVRGGVRVAWNDSPGSATTGSALNTSEELEGLLERAIGVAAERPDLAPLLWQRVLDEGAAAFARSSSKNTVQLRRAYEIYRPFSNESLKAIVAAGSEALRYYRLHSDGPARALMARQGAGREAALAEVVRRYFLTTVGDDAALELACLHLERGDFISADQLLERLTLYPDSNIAKDEIAVRRAVTQAHLGRTDVALALVNSLGGELDSVKPLLLQELSKTPAASAAANRVETGEPSDIAAASALGPAWEVRPQWTLKGSRTSANNQAVLSGSGEGGRPVIFVRQPGGNYVQAALDDKDIPEIGYSQLGAQWRSAGWRPASSPVVSDGRIYLKSESRTMCCDAQTGGVLWMGRPTRFPMDEWSRQMAKVAAHGVNVAFSSSTFIAGPQPKTMTEIMLFSDRLNHQLTVSGGRVFAIEGELDTPATRKPNAPVAARAVRGGPGQPQSLHNELACYDAATGRFQWSAGSDSGLPEGASLWSRPLAVESQVIVAISAGGQLGIAAFEASSGKLLWTTMLADLGRSGPTIPAGLAVDDGAIYVASGVGTLFSVDRNGGSLRWAASYPRLKSANFDRRAIDGSTGERFQIVLEENFVAREDDLVILAAGDSDHIMAFSATDGALRWDSPIPAPVLSGSPGYVAGMGGGRLHLASRNWLWTLNTRGGRMIWDRPLESSCGRGLLAGDALLISEGGSLLDLDPATGKQRKSTAVTTPDGEPIGNLLASGNQILVASAARLLALKPTSADARPMSTKDTPAPKGAQP